MTRHGDPQGSYGYPGYPERYVYVPVARPTSGLAVASLVLGLLGFSGLAVILGWIGYRETENGAKDDKGMAVAGLVLGVLGSLLWTVFFVVPLMAAMGSVR